MFWQLKSHSGTLHSLSRPWVMGIVNVTPDSFAVHCTDLSEKTVLSVVDRQLREGADILDIGGYSTRPDGGWVSEAEEWSRLEPALRVIRSSYPEVLLSVDTWRSSIAERAVSEYGVDIVNDVSGGEWDKEMFGTMARLKAAYVLTHNRWQSPATHEISASGNDIVSEVLHFFETRLYELGRMGVSDVILDPGFGFGKRAGNSGQDADGVKDENYALLKELSVFQTLHCPILAGLSRKSMLYKPLHTTPSKALNATTAANMIALIKKASLLRVHDVRQAKEVVTIYQSVYATT
ncbi:MAG: dihydropteroate synthase [Paludibacteraceae bacterium]|nr:dihydropteroate synthase [Paludibacteraceae bacterium]